MDLSLRDITYILAIKTEGSITKAAQALYIAQPSLTQALKKIEQKLGVTLFIRSANSLKLTYAGECFLDSGRKILKIARDLENELHEISNQDRGRIILGITLYLGSYMFVKIKEIYSRLHPNVEIKIIERTSDELERLVLSGEVDVAILPTAEFFTQGIRYVPLFSAKILMVMHKDHWLKEHFYYKEGVELPFVDLRLAAEEPFISGKSGQRLTELVDTVFQKASIAPPVVFRSRSVETIKRLASAGIGLAFIPEYYRTFIRTDIESIYCHIEDKYTPQWTVSALCQGREKTSAIIQEFLNVLKEAFPSPPEA